MDVAPQVVPLVPVPTLCPTCHQAVMQQYYFCPNCGTNLRPAPLSTSSGTQVWIYGLSIILPLVLFIGISKWPAMKYFRSSDPQEKMIGQIALILIVLSTLLTVWLTYKLTLEAIQSQVASINADMSI